MRRNSPLRFGIDEASIPEQVAVSGTVAGNKLSRLLRPEGKGRRSVTVSELEERPGLLFHTGEEGEFLVVERPDHKGDYGGDVLLVPRGTLADPASVLSRAVKKRWIGQHAPTVLSPDPEVWRRYAADARDSWPNRFSYRMGDPATGSKGLRTPQLGALYAVLAHWTVTPEEPATIVMPTGTGKTETMIALLVNRCLERVLVVVPTVALREQMVAKFLSFGVLKPDVVAAEARYPVVGEFQHQFHTAEEAEAFLSCCNVVVATMQAVNGCSEEVRRRICDRCSHLIIDEAHHVKAPSWESLRTRFYGKPILQFTATPYRNDGKPIGGRMIYTYPLLKAQQENYFTKIRYRPVFSLSNPDHAIANAAVEQLREDLAHFDHIVMARVDTIERAEEVLAVYRGIAPDLNPQIIHSDMKVTPRRQALEALYTRRSRVIVCVNMLGEGFDFPELKIAALHDIHKSLAITLQFTGRFTRAQSDLGEATMIANRANVDVNKRLRALYSEDADWNQIIRDLGQEATGEQQVLDEFKRTFSSLPREVPLQVIEPKMSTVVFRTTCDDWNPDGVFQIFPLDMLHTPEPAVSHQHRVLWFVTRETAEIRWGELRELENVTYNLYLVHWDEERKLLFINSSNNDSVHEELAKALTSEETELVMGPDIYRVLSGIQRMVPTNLGLLDHVSRSRRFTSYTGADVVEGLDPSQTQTRSKTNIFGYGYEGGERTSIGCSLKGRIWSYQVAYDLSRWVRWCHHVADKLLDESIDIDAVIKGFIKPRYVTARPPLVPLAVEWPLAFLQEQEDRIDIDIDGHSSLYFDVSLEITEHTKEGPVRFRVQSDTHSAGYEAVFGGNGTQYRAVGKEAVITIGRRSKPLSEWFGRYAPKFYFEQDTFIEHDLLIRPERETPPFDLDRIEVWDWTGVNIQKESQGYGRAADTVQHRVIQTLLNDGQGWDLVFDDDESGEMADVVAIKMTPDRLIVHLYHCKFSGEERPGSRVDDFYVVCGQSQKSTHWRDRSGLINLIPHLLRRERGRLEKELPTRFERGGISILEEIAERQEVLRPEFKVSVVQPGLSKAKATLPVLQLLAGTSLYLHETFAIDFGVVSSP